MYRIVIGMILNHKWLSKLLLNRASAMRWGRTAVSTIVQLLMQECQSKTYFLC